MSTIILKINLLAAGKRVSFLQSLKSRIHKWPAHSSAGNMSSWRHLLEETTSGAAEENRTDISMEAPADSELGEITGLAFDLVQSFHSSGKPKAEGSGQGHC